MNEISDKTAASSSEVEALSSAFGSFVRVTEELRASYERLRERADRIDYELARTNEQLAGILKAIPTGVVVYDAQDRIADWNEAAARILELPRDRAIGKTREELRDALGQTLLMDIGLAASPAAKERRRVLGNGRAIVLGGGISEIRDTQGNLSGRVEVLEDLTELWELRDRIHRIDKLAALGEMSAVIAHEIRNPLNGVQGFADLLSRKLQSGEPKLADYAAKIVRGVREVDAIIADLLAFAAPERFQPVSLPLREIVHQASESVLQALPEPRSNALRVENTIPEALRIAGDALKLGQVFRNLIANAADAMPHGGTIRVEARDAGSSALVSLEDEGPGVSEELRSKIFDPFFTTKTQGTGLGLAIVRKIVELHGGTIGVANPKRVRGARFEIRIPKT